MKSKAPDAKKQKAPKQKKKFVASPASLSLDFNQRHTNLVNTLLSEDTPADWLTRWIDWYLPAEDAHEEVELDPNQRLWARRVHQLSENSSTSVCCFKSSGLYSNQSMEWHKEEEVASA